jgi:mitofusin
VVACLLFAGARPRSSCLVGRGRNWLSPLHLISLAWGPGLRPNTQTPKMFATANPSRQRTNDVDPLGRKSPLLLSRDATNANRIRSSSNNMTFGSTALGNMNALKTQLGTDAQGAFLTKRNQLLGLIKDTSGLVGNMQKRVDDSVGTKYPLPATLRAIKANSQTTLDNQKETPEELNVLNLDVKSSGKKSTDDILASLDEASTAKLLQDKLAEVNAYLEKLFARISDTSSKVLVTGDLNAGKSTFVNSLLRREVAPQDQQPCTTAFCEIIDAKENDDVEEVHAIEDPAKYSRTDPTTFAKFDLRQLRSMVTEDAEPHPYVLFKIYCHDNRATPESLLHNGAVDLSLIDSPGLNIDSLKTTKLFAQQEEIDVVVFMVHAENQFTLSVLVPLIELTFAQGKEFLQNVGKEKGQVFIVVNRFDQIEDQERCKRDILEQVRKLSPQTFADAKNLIHFVSAKETVKATNEGGAAPESYENMEQALRSFVLEKRENSKLAPAQTYLHNLLSDVDVIAKYNLTQAEALLMQIATDLDQATPQYEEMMQIKETVLDDIDKTIDETSIKVQNNTKEKLAEFLDNIEKHGAEAEWKGVLHALQYAKEIRAKLYQIAGQKVKESDEFARLQAEDTIRKIQETTAKVVGAEAANQITKDAVDQINPEEKTLSTVPLQLVDFFDYSDRVEMLKEYVPSVTMIASGLYGYSRIADTLLRMGSDGLITLGKFGMVGLALAGRSLI